MHRRQMGNIRQAQSATEPVPIFGLPGYSLRRVALGFWFLVGGCLFFVLAGRERSEFQLSEAKPR